jgi:hypothetical protein
MRQVIFFTGLCFLQNLKLHPPARDKDQGYFLLISWDRMRPNVLVALTNKWSRVSVVDGRWVWGIWWDNYWQGEQNYPLLQWLPQTKTKSTWISSTIPAFVGETVDSGTREGLIPTIFHYCLFNHRLCGLVVRVLGYRSGGPGSITGTTTKKK